MISWFKLGLAEFEYTGKTSRLVVITSIVEAVY